MEKEIRKQIFEELVNEMNFLERNFNDALELIYGKLERLKGLENGKRNKKSK